MVFLRGHGIGAHSEQLNGGRPVLGQPPLVWSDASSAGKY